MAGNCAWCGDPPDEYGSHGICETHAAAMIAQSRARHAASEEEEDETESSASGQEVASQQA
jgi:hypothetical protein